jgi:hypothetical protein
MDLPLSGPAAVEESGLPLRVSDDALVEVLLAATTDVGS